MPEFTQSWAFWFIIGCFAVAVIVFILWIICAASGRASRMEERISDEAIYEAEERERKRRDDYLSSKQMVSDVEDILGRKSG